MQYLTQKPSLMSLALASALLAAGSAPTLAQSRPLSTSMSCDQARGLIASKGAVVMSTGPSLYDRFVSGIGYCTPSETIIPAFVPTKTNPQCLIGYTCMEMSREEKRN